MIRAIFLSYLCTASALTIQKLNDQGLKTDECTKCASGIQTLAAIRTYWHSRAYPTEMSKPAAFDISSPTQLQTGSDAGVFGIKDGKVTLDQQGTRFVGTLTPNCQSIDWSDGDSWDLDGHLPQSSPCWETGMSTAVETDEMMGSQVNGHNLQLPPHVTPAFVEGNPNDEVRHGTACNPGKPIEEAQCYEEMKSKGDVFVCDPSADGYYHGTPLDLQLATAGTGGCHSYVFLNQAPSGCTPGKQCFACKWAQHFARTKSSSAPCFSHLWAVGSSPTDGSEVCTWKQSVCPGSMMGMMSSKMTATL